MVESRHSLAILFGSRRP